MLFHLEENPEDPSTQEVLFEMAGKMMAELLRKYPEYTSHVACIITSNYPPAQKLRDATTLIQMVPPTRQVQLRSCASKLKTFIARKLGDTRRAHSMLVDVDLVNPPPAIDDMRPMETWTTSLGYHVVRRVDNALNRHADAVNSQHVRLFVVLGGVDKHTLETSYTLATSATPRHGTDNIGSTSVNSSSHVEECDLVCSESWTLASKDGFFFYSADEMGERETGMLEGIAPQYAPQIITLTGMMKFNFLKPSVIVLEGSDRARSAYADCIEKLLDTTFAGCLCKTSLTIMSEDDKRDVVGDPKEIRGGLFKFIDEATNPAILREQDQHCLVVATVNEVGQYILRELLEDSASKTHRQSVRKDRVLFLLSLTEGSNVTHPVRSRAHAMIHCD